jgi:hypothetical protein
VIPLGVSQRNQMAERVGFGLSPDVAATQVIDSTKSQNRHIRTKSRSQVHCGYTEDKVAPVRSLELPESMDARIDASQ